MDPSDGFVEVKRGGDEMENGYSYGRSQRGYSSDSPSSPTKTPNQVYGSTNPPPLSHASSSNSNASASIHSFSQSSATYADRPVSYQSDATAVGGSGGQRPSLGDNPRLSSGPGDRMGSLSSLKGGVSGNGNGSSEVKEDIVPVGFDEGVLRGLCDMDCALPLLADRIKQSIASCKQVAVFFRSRAEIEEKYARSLLELCRSTSDIYSRADGKAGTFVTAYHSSLKIQEQIGANRIRFAQRLNEMSDELLGLAREGEKLRKLHKDNGTRYQGILQESETVMDKARSRFDSTTDELERILVAKEGENLKDSGMRSSTSNSSTNTSGSLGQSTSSSSGGKRGIGKAMSKGGLLFKGKGPAQMQRQEDDVRSRMSMASETFRKAVLESQSLRQEYFHFQLPKILRNLKECADELDMGTQYHLSRFAFLYETAIVGDGTILNPMGTSEEGPGLKSVFESIDNRTDFKSYMQNYAVARGTPRGPRREGPYDEGFLPPLPPHVQASQNALQTGTPQASSNGTPNSVGQQPLQVEYSAVPGIPASTGATFGVDLGEQLNRDGTEVPRIVEKCAEAIEAYGLELTGIYRLSGTTSKIQALKGALDRDVNAVDVLSEDWSADINVVSGALKLWFRELPEPLLTYGLYHGFIEAARYENDRLRHIRLHEQVNELPDPNYATLKFFMAHLDRVRRKESQNQMSISNLSIVFGPTLLGAPPEEGGLNLEHMSYQCKAIETILEKYQEIFVEEDEDSVASAAPAAEGVSGD